MNFIVLNIEYIANIVNMKTSLFLQFKPAGFKINVEAQKDQLPTSHQV